MPYVKIVIVESRYLDEDTSREVIAEGISNWEEVTDEELALLKRYIYHGIKVPSYRHTPMVIVQDDVPVQTRIDNIREHLKNIEAQNNAAEAKRKKDAANRKAKKAERERQKLAELQAKYGGAK